jgi:hypothetical protein
MRLRAPAARPLLAGDLGSALDGRPAEQLVQPPDQT